MLRFDIPPVFSHVIRWEAFLVFCLCLLALFVSPWFLAILPLQGLIKGFIGQWNLTYMKHMIVPFNGPLWVIEKNSLGIPEYRMAKPYIYIIYKDPKETMCNVGALYMRENYAGGGTYGAPYLGGIRDVEYIDCAVVK